MAATDANGALVSTFQYDPFGTPASTTPDNTALGSSYSWVGQHQKVAETSLVLNPTQMGARVYLPTLGRFAQVDPIEGGTENNYVYPADPVNDFDLTGHCVSRLVSLCARAVPFVDRVTNRGWQGVKSVGRKISPWNGEEFKIKGIRFKPTGLWKKYENGRPGWPTRLPHWHQKTTPKHKGDRYGSDWHRPWQTTFRRWFR